MANRRGKVEAVAGVLFLISKITMDSDCSREIRRRLLLGRKAMTHLDSVLKSRDIADKDPYSQGCGLPSNHVWLWELDRKEGRAPKNWCLQTVVLEKTPESPVDSKEIKPVNLKGNQPWIFIGRTDASLSSSTLITWCEQPTHWKSPWERLRAEGEEGVRGWDGWMASLMQWAWTWANFRRWWGTGRSGVVQFMGSQRAEHDWATEQQQSDD